jgi:hypothetical protein
MERSLFKPPKFQKLQISKLQKAQVVSWLNRPMAIPDQAKTVETIAAKVGDDLRSFIISSSVSGRQLHSGWLQTYGLFNFTPPLVKHFHLGTPPCSSHVQSPTTKPWSSQYFGQVLLTKAHRPQSY